MQSKYSKPAVAVLSGATSAPFPPTSWAYVDPQWNSMDRVPDQFECQIWSTAADNLTAATLYRGALRPLTFAASSAITASSVTSLFTLAAHGYQTGDGPLQFTDSGGTLPAGVSLLTDYWIVWVSSSTFSVATSFANAMAATPVTVALTTNGTGTIKLTGDSANTTSPPSRVYWLAVALLNETGATTAGSITLTAVQGYSGRFNHNATSVAYAISATLSAGTVNAQVVPISTVG